MSTVYDLVDKQMATVTGPTVFYFAGQSETSFKLTKNILTNVPINLLFINEKVSLVFQINKKESKFT